MPLVAPSLALPAKAELLPAKMMLAVKAAAAMRPIFQAFNARVPSPVETMNGR
jgi:hypothetical protein